MINFEAVRTGFVEIYSHKMRSFLSFSGIAFGVAAILYTFASVNEMFIKRAQAFDLAGPGRMTISKKWRRGGNTEESTGLSKGLTSIDAAVIAQAMPWLYMVSPIVETNAVFRYGDFNTGLSVTGITTEWRKRNWVYKLQGRFFNERDMRTAARVCLLNEPGGWAKKKPFWYKRWGSRWKSPFEGFVKRNEMLGQKIRLNDTIFTVVGILKNPPRDKDPRWFSRGSGAVYIPMTTAQRYLPTGGAKVPEAVSRIIVDTGKTATVERALHRVEALLRVRHRGENDFEVKDFREVIEHFIERMRKEAIRVLSVGIVAILAGGVGIMNVTLATIFSRIREIGVRRAVGATRGDILFQFITEAMMLGLLGGIAGIALGIVGILKLTEDGPEQLEQLLVWHYAATLGISVFAGFIFSLYPAYQASKLDPVEALRYE